uniref:Triple QxxK/R motif-containing protein n=2 Tax=Amblyomma TaxID=6942 RepID=A0A023FNW7_AMBCJ
MGRARKDSFNNQPPVEAYRKVIGKQDYKKSKSELKESKKRAQSKKTSSKTYKEIATMLGFLLAVLFGGYALSYVFLTGNVPSLWASDITK